MFKFLAKSAVFSLIWNRYRKIILSTIVLFGSYFVISLMHTDYLDYAKLSQSEHNIAVSYGFKWAALLLTSAVYYWTNVRQPPLSKNNQENTAPSKTSRKPQAASNAPSLKPPSGDPFAEIRKKDKLSSKGDRILKE